MVYSSIEAGNDDGLQPVSAQVGCHCFPPGPWLFFQPVGHYRPEASTRLFCLVTETHGCE